MFKCRSICILLALLVYSHFQFIQWMSSIGKEMPLWLFFHFITLDLLFDTSWGYCTVLFYQLQSSETKKDTRGVGMLTEKNIERHVADCSPYHHLPNPSFSFSSVLFPSVDRTDEKSAANFKMTPTHLGYLLR